MFSSVSRADGVATAQALFEQGRDLLKAGKLADACPKLAESQRLDPATGTLLALATCHEAQGRLASAWAEFSGVVTRAAREGHSERERWARRRVEALKPRLSTLELRVPAQIESLVGAEVQRDEVRLGNESWNVAVPVDGGEHHITAQAPGMTPWSASVLVKQERDAVVLAVPELVPARAPEKLKSETPVGAEATVQTPPPLTVPAAQPAAADSSFSRLQWVGVASLGLGLGALGAGGVCLYKALDETKQTYTDTAELYGNWATGLFIGGGVVAAAGLGLLFFGVETESPNATLVRHLALGVGPGAVQLGFKGDF
jgi:hypothetical protein